MKDLLVYVADADAQAFLKSILSKHHALGIRAITFDIERHPQRDAGMVQSGAELTRMQKGRYEKALLVWDHHGSGRDHKSLPQEVEREMQSKLDSFTWKENSAVAVLVPELEQWLWYCENALLAHYRLTKSQLDMWLGDYAKKCGALVDSLKEEQPKELFEWVVRDCLKRTISPRDFEEIGRSAGVSGLMGCGTFCSVVETLRAWFSAC